MSISFLVPCDHVLMQGEKHIVYVDDSRSVTQQDCLSDIIDQTMVKIKVFIDTNCADYNLEPESFIMGHLYLLQAMTEQYQNNTD